MRKFVSGLAIGLVLSWVVAAVATVSPFWSQGGPGTTNGTTPSTVGPWLGDNIFNVYTLWLSHHQGSGYGFSAALSISQTTGQANCTVLNNDKFQQVTTSAATGYVCLPTATAGKELAIAMVPAQTLDIYSSNTPFVVGTADTINGTAGSTAYTSNTGSNRTTTCRAFANGAWNCVTGN